MDVNQPSAIRAVDLAILRGIDFLISPGLSQTTDLDIAQHSVDASPPIILSPPSSIALLFLTSSPVNRSASLKKSLSSLPISLAQTANTFHLFDQILPTTMRKHRDAILLTLGATHHDMAVVEAGILQSQATALVLIQAAECFQSSNLRFTENRKPKTQLSRFP